jgi:hypothetical protein
MARVLDVTKKVAPSKPVTLRPSLMMSSGPKKQRWANVTRMKTAVGYTRLITDATAKRQLVGKREVRLMGPVMVMTAQLFLETLKVSVPVVCGTRHQNCLSMLHAVLTNSHIH